ncbi:unnamed protein product, partial [marine sediment metagenome]
MTSDRSKTIEKCRKRYLNEYKYIHKKDDRITIFEEISEKAAAAGATAWKKFADGTSAYLKEEHEAALALFDESIALDQEFAYPLNGKGNVFSDQKRYDEALVA